MNGRFNLAIKIEEKIHLISYLSFEQHKRELFYGFANKGSQLVSLHDEKGNTTQQRMPDHISFHNDGTIHVRHKDLKRKKKKVNVIKGNPNIFNVGDDKYCPLLIHSFYVEDCPAENLSKILPEPNDLTNTKIWELNGQANFSIILFVLGKRVALKRLATDLGFLRHPSMKSVFLREPLVSQGQSPDFSKPFRDANIFILFSNKVIKRSSSIETMLKDAAGETAPVFSFGVAPPLDALRDLV